MFEADNPEPIISRLRDHDPRRHLVLTAIDVLTTPGDMSRFLEEYAQFLKENNPDRPDYQENPTRTAATSIDAALGFISEEATQRWMEGVEAMRDPAINTRLHTHQFHSASEAYFAGTVRGNIDSGQRDN